MPDFDPSKERHVNHRFIVQNAWGTDTDSVKHDGKKFKFDKYNRFMLKDEGLAREIQQENPKFLTVTRVRYPDVADRGHTYHFGLIRVPWHKYDENGNRIKEDENV